MTGPALDGRDAAYRAAGRGELPVIKVGRRLIVPMPALLRLLGAEPTPDNGTAGVVAPAVAFDHDTTELTRERLHQANSLRAV